MVSILNVMSSLFIWYVMGVLCNQVTLENEKNGDSIGIPKFVNIQRLGFAIAFMLLTIRLCSICVVLYHMIRGYKGVAELGAFVSSLIVVFIVATATISAIIMSLVIAKS